MLARVERLTLVDPFLAQFIASQSASNQFRQGINTARELLTDNLNYITEKMQTLVFINPDKSSGSLGHITTQSIDMPRMQRCSHFFNVMQLQLTYTMRGMRYTTIDFTEIRLIGQPSRKIGHSNPINLVQYMGQSPQRTFPICDICGNGGANEKWAYATNCGHLWHERCYRGPGGPTCTVCLRHTWIQRKRAAS